jgi:O-antigen/teichoic acid export membrane protein
VVKTPARVDIVRESVLTFLYDSGDKVAAFAAFVFFANYFTTADFGAAYTVIGASMMAGGVPKSVGVAVQKRVSEDTRSYERYFVASILVLAVFAVVAAVAGVVVGRLFLDRYRVLTAAGVVHAVTRPFLYIVERTYDGVGSPGAAAGLDFVDGVLTAALRFVLILGLGMGEEGLLYSGAVSAVAVGGVAYLRRFGVPRARPGGETLADLFSFSRWAVVARISNNVYVNAPVVLAGLLLSPGFVSFLKAAQTLVSPGRLPGRSVTKSIFVQVSGNVERDDDVLSPVQKGVDVASVVALPLAVGGAIVGDAVMVTLYGESYAGSAPVLVAVAVGLVFETQGQVFVSALSGSDNVDRVARANLAAAVGFVPLYAGTMVFAGPTAFLVAFALSYFLRTVALRRYADETVLDTGRVDLRFVGEQALAAAAMGLVVWPVARGVAVRSWVDLVAPLGVGGVAYFGVLFLLSARFRSIATTVAERFVPQYQR